MPCISRLLAVFLQWSFVFDYMPVHVGFLVVKVAVGQVVPTTSAFLSQHHFHRLSELIYLSLTYVM
jgi:hypothetical protein